MDVRLYEIALNTAKKLERARYVRLLRDEIAEIETLIGDSLNSPQLEAFEWKGILSGLRRALTLIQQEEGTTD